LNIEAQIEFDNLEFFQQGQQTIVRKGYLGGRFLKLDKVKHDRTILEVYSALASIEFFHVLWVNSTWIETSQLYHH
jgi:hypothetical protein